MSADMRTLAERRRTVLRAALELGDGIAAIRRRLERARGIEPNPTEFNDLDSEGRDRAAGGETATPDSH